MIRRPYRLPLPICDDCGRYVLAVPPPGLSVYFSAGLRDALASELDRMEALFVRLPQLVSPFRVSPRWWTRARSKAFVLRGGGRLDRARYLRAGKVGADLDALRFTCACGERASAIRERAAAFAVELPGTARLELERDARDVPRLVARLRQVGAEEEGLAVARTAGAFWTA